MKKVTNKKGFTLAELLIVVAIIAVLVAIAIPVFGTALEKAQLSADAATVRANLAEAIVNGMTADDYAGTVSITIGQLSANVHNCSITVTAGDAANQTQGSLLVAHRSNNNHNLDVTIPVDADVTITGGDFAAPTA